LRCILHHRVAQFLRLHREWVAGELEVYNPHEMHKPPPGVHRLMLPTAVRTKPQQSMFAAGPVGAKPEVGGNGKGRGHTPKTPRDVGRGTPHGQKTPRDSTDKKGRTPRNSEDEQNSKREKEILAAKTLQRHVRGRMLGRITYVVPQSTSTCCLWFQG
jgi:hypothetical protein